MERRKRFTAKQFLTSGQKHHLHQMFTVRRPRVACVAVASSRRIELSKDPILLKSSEAAARLGISTTTLFRYVKAGRIECICVEKNSVYFTVDALEEFVQRHRKRYCPRSVA